MIEVRDLATGVGIAMAIEGALWAAAPGAMRRMMVQIEGASENTLRISALIMLAIGVGIVWAARSALQGG
jgi:uncharacterized protein YjeT (DUF2065 family)